MPLEKPIVLCPQLLHSLIIIKGMSKYGLLWSDQTRSTEVADIHP